MKKLFSVITVFCVLFLSNISYAANETDSQIFIRTFYNSVIDTCYEYSKSNNDCSIISLGAIQAVDSIIYEYNLVISDDVLYQWKQTSFDICNKACIAGKNNNLKNKENLKNIIELTMNNSMDF
jgi:hypothetical protein